MKPIQFPESNVTFAKDQPQYLPLPAHRANDEFSTVTFCWELSLKERLKLLITGKLWHQILTFKHPLQPQMLWTKKPNLNDPEALHYHSITLKHILLNKKYYYRRFLGWLPIQFCMTCGKPYWGGLPRFWLVKKFQYPSTHQTPNSHRKFQCTWQASWMDYCSKCCADADLYL